MRTSFSITWPVRAINGGPKGIRLEIDPAELVKIYPILKGANLGLIPGKAKPKPAAKPRKSRREQARVYRKLLDSGQVKNQAELARRFGVSETWISKVLNS